MLEIWCLKYLNPALKTRMLIPQDWIKSAFSNQICHCYIYFGPNSFIVIHTYIIDLQTNIIPVMRNIMIT